MKRFGMYIARWIVVLFVLFYLLDALYTWVYKNSIPRNKVSYVLSEKNRDIDYIFLGSSRVDNFIDVEIIEKITGKKALNLGVQGGNLDDSYLMFQLLEEQKIKTSIVFVQVDYSYNGGNPSLYLKSAMIPFIKNPVVARYSKKWYPDYWKLRYFPFYRYMAYDYKLGFREFSASLINKKPRVSMINGFHPVFGTPATMEANLPIKVATTNEAIRKMKILAKKMNIKLVFFTSPFCGDTKNIAFIEQLGLRFEHFMNYSEIFKDNDTYFYNCSHVNDKGAAIFSTRIAEDIVSKYQN
jgi:hypothetical protein